MQNALAHWGVSVLRELHGGHRNRVFLVERRGALFVAKTTRHSEASLRWLMPVLAVATRVGLAPPLLLQDGEGRFAPGGVTLEPFVAGRSGQLHELLALTPQIGRFHAALRGTRPRPARLAGRAPQSHLGACRVARSRLPAAPLTVIHGDLNLANLFVTEKGPSLIDWDEARVDHPAFDLPLRDPSAPVVRARHAREVIVGWHLEPTYARTLARRRRQFS